MRILLLTAHSIAEHDDLRMFSEMGHEVFSIGAYTKPAEPSDDKRPALPQVTYYPELAKLVEGDQMAHKAHLPAELIDWADVIIAHHFVDTWIAGQWPRIKHKRVIWRTCGQSNPALEAFMAPGRDEGLQIVRYSPKERNLPNYAGEDALIRFGKEPSDYGPWNGTGQWVANVTQNMLQRGDACGLSFWLEATKGLPSLPAGPGSDALGGRGSLTFDEMKQYLCDARVYLYTGTQPASYTLGLIEAMMTGVPVVSIGPKAFGPGWIGDVFEGHEIVARDRSFDDPAGARQYLGWMLDQPDLAASQGAGIRQRAIALFGMDKIKAEWAAFLG